MTRYFSTIMRNLLFALTASTFLPNAVLAQNGKPEQSLSVGYTDYAVDGYWGTGSKAHLSAAIRLENPEGKGQRIIALRCAIGACEEVSDCKLFIKKDLEKDENLYEQEFAPEYGWNYVYLDFPFNVDGMEELYIGYELTSAEDAIGYGHAGGDEEGNDCLRVNYDAWTNLSRQGLGDAAHCLSAIFEGGEYAAHEQNAAGLEDALLPKRVKAGETFFLEGTLDNLGVCTLHSFDVVCQINGGEETHHPQEAALLHRECAPFTFPIEVPQGRNTVRIRLQAANGMPGNASFDQTYTVDAYAKAFPHTLLVEYFTSQNCANCPAGKAVLDQAMRGHEGQIAVVNHHAGFSNDLFTIQESLALAEQWNVKSAPILTLDRSASRVNGADLFVFHPAFITSSMIRERLADRALANVEISNTFYTGDNHLEVRAKVEKDEAFPSSARLHIFLCENGYAASQTGEGAYWENYEHNHFPRAVLTALEGDALAYGNGGVAEAVCTYAVPAEYPVIGKEETTIAHPERMEIVAFVAEFDEAAGNYTVYNAAVQALNPVEGTSVCRPDEEDAALFTVRGGEGWLRIDGNFDKAEIYDTAGIRAGTLCEPGRAVRLAPGIYAVRITHPGGTSVKKAVVHGH